MSLSKIEALKNSHRRSAIKQEIIPKIEPIIRPTRDKSIQNRTTSLNIKQSTGNDIFAYERRVQQLERELQQYQFQHQANLVYNKQFKSLGKLFGDENLQFEEIRQKIQDIILNTNQRGSKDEYRKNNLLRSDDKNLTQFFTYTKQQLKDKLVQAQRSEFLSILQLGSSILLENETSEQRKRKSIREMFYEIWRQILLNSQQSTSKFYNLQEQSKHLEFNENENRRMEQKTRYYESQILQKNKYIAQLAQQLEKVTNLFSEKTSKTKFYKDNYELLESECQSLSQQNTQLFQQTISLKREIMVLQDRVREHEDKELQKITLFKDNSRELQMLKQQIREVKLNKEKQSRDLINKIDELMLNVNRYDSTISELEGEKNQMLRQIWVHKGNLEQVSNKLKKIQNENLKYKQQNQILEQEIKKNKDRYQKLDNDTEGRVHELNDQIMNIRQQFDHKESQYKNKIQLLLSNKQNLQNEIEMLVKQYKALEENNEMRDNMDSQPHTAVFGTGNKLSEEMRTSLIDDRVVELEQLLKKIQENSEKQKNQLLFQFNQQKSSTQSKEKRLKQLQAFLQNTKNLIKKTQDEKTKFKQLCEVLKGEKYEIQRQLNEGKQKIRGLQSQLGDMSIEMERMRGEIIKLENIGMKKSNIQQKVINYERIIRQLQNKHEDYVKIQDRYKLELMNVREVYQNKLTLLQKSLEIERQEIQKNKQNITMLNKTLLQKQRDHAEKYSSLNSYIAQKNNQINGLNYQIQKLSANLNTQLNKAIRIEEESREFEAYKQQNQFFKAEIQRNKNELNKIIKQVNILLTTVANLQRLIKQLESKYYQEMGKDKTQIKLLSEKGIGSARVIIESSENLIQQLNSKPHQNVEELKQAYKNLSLLASQLENIIKNKEEQQLEKINQIKLNASREKQWQQQLIAYQNKLNESQFTINQKDQYIGEIKKALEIQSQKIQKLVREHAQMQQNYNPILSECNELQKNHEALTLKLKDGQIQISQLKSLNKALQQQSANLKQLNQTLRSQNSMFRQTNDQLRSQISHLTSNNGILEEQKNNLLNTVHSMNEQLVRLSNQKLELSAFLGIGSGHSDQSSGNGHKKIISKYYVNNNGNQNKNQLHTIKQVINSQNQLQEQHGSHNYQTNNIPLKVAEQNLNKKSDQEFTSREIDLRKNQAFKQEQYKNQYGQFRNRPGVPKNSVKYEALLKQSFDLESNQVNRTQNNPTSNGNQMNKNLSGSSGSQNELSLSNKSLPNKNGSISNIEGESNNKSVKKQEENGSPRSKTFIESINKINGQGSYNLNKTQKESEKNIQDNQIITHSMQSFSPAHEQTGGKKKMNNHELSESFDEEQSRDIVNNINLSQNRPSETRISHKEQKHRQQISETQKQKSEENVSIKIHNDGQAQILSSLQNLSQKYLKGIKQLQSISPINQQESILQKQQIKKLQQNYQSSQKQIEMIYQNNQRQSDQQIISLDRIQIKNPSQTFISDTNLSNRQNTEKIISQEIKKIQQPIIESLSSNVHSNSHIQTQTMDNRIEMERSNTHRSTAYFGNNSHITAKFNSQFHTNFQETNLQSPIPNSNINQSSSITVSNKVISSQKGSQSEVKKTVVVLPNQQTNRIYGSFSNANIGYQNITIERDMPKQYVSPLPSQEYNQISAKPIPHNVIYTERKVVSENIINSSRQIYSQRDTNTVTHYNNRLQVYGQTPQIIRVSANSPRGQVVNINQHASTVRSTTQEVNQSADNRAMTENDKKKQQSDKQLVSSMSRAIFESGTNLPLRLYQSTSNNQQNSSIQSITGVESQQRQQLNKMTNSYSVRSLQNQSLNSINLPNQSINQIQKSQKQAQNKIVNGLEDGSKSVASQKNQNIQEEHPPIKQNIQIKLNPPSQQIIPNNAAPISTKAIQNIGMKYGSNVQQAESVNTMREITTVQSQTGKEVSLNKNLQQQNKNIQSIKSIEQARISINPPPISMRTQQAIPTQMTNNIYTSISSPRILINQNQSFRPLSSSFQNRYPSPSKVAFAEKIDKIQRHQTVHKIVSVSPNIVVHNYIRQSNKVDEPHSKLITIKSQPNLLMNQRSLSPPQAQTQKLVYHQPISPSNLIATSQRSISPPQQNNYNSGSSISMSQRMVDTFNPNSIKNIYTAKNNTQPMIPRPQSTLSPIKVISESTKNIQNSNNKINEGFYAHTHTKGDNSIEKQQNMFSLNASQATQNRRVQLNPSINSIIPMQTFNSISVKTEQPPHQNYQSSSNQGHQFSSNNAIFSGKGMEMTGRLVSSRDGSIQSGNKQQTFEGKPISPKIVTSPRSQIYGLQAPKPIKFNQASSKNKEMGEQVNNKYRFSSRPVTQTTHIHNLYSDNGFEIKRNSQYPSAKQLSQEQVFSSKHKIVEGFTESNSSGIDVQQKDSLGNCCPNC